MDGSRNIQRWVSPMPTPNGCVKLQQLCLPFFLSWNYFLWMEQEGGRGDRPKVWVTLQQLLPQGACGGQVWPPGALPDPGLPPAGGLLLCGGLRRLLCVVYLGPCLLVYSFFYTIFAFPPTCNSGSCLQLNDVVHSNECLWTV